MRRLLLSAALAVLTALAVAAPASANEAEAKAAYARGRDHFKNGKYAEAIVELKKAYALKPHPALLRYMADTYFKMNKARLAIEHYKRYLKEAPEAADKDKIEAKVRQLEMIVGDDDDKGTAAKPPPPTPTPTPTPPPAPPLPPDGDDAPARPTKKIDAPTGEDREMPTALNKKLVPSIDPNTPAAPERKDDGGGSALKIAGWSVAAVAVGGLTMGIVFNRLAAKKAQQLEDAVRGDCPDKSPTCPGNPDMNRPVVAFSADHYNIQQSWKSNRNVSIAMLVTGAVMVPTAAALLFFGYRRAKTERKAAAAGASNLVVAPVLGGGSYGLVGEVTF